MAAKKKPAKKPAKPKLVESPILSKFMQISSASWPGGVALFALTEKGEVFEHHPSGGWVRVTEDAYRYELKPEKP